MSTPSVLRNSMTEEQLGDTVIGLAHLFGWKIVHFRPARTERGWRTLMQGDTGFPDLVIARDGQVIFAELKSAKGRLRPDQEAWINALGFCYVWRPADLDFIKERLR